MEWIEAALAFAVIMMVFSTMVTVMVETLHRFLRIREKGLEEMMETVYIKVIQPRLSMSLELQGATVNRFVEKMTSTRFQPVASSTGFKLVTKFVNLFNANTDRLKSLTTLEFVERLAETPVGRSLVSEAKLRGKEHADDFLKDLASKYEDIGESASDYFARRSQVISIWLALALAIALNVNAIHLFQTLLTNEDVRNAWIKQGEKVADQAKQQQEELDKFLAESPGAGNVSSQEIQQAVDANIKQLNAAAVSLRDSGIPIGWENAPWNSMQWQTADALSSGWMLVMWILDVLLAGLLIGLGGPFWFDTFRKLSALTAMMRGLQTPVQKTKEPGQQQQGTTAVQDDSEFIKIFETAAKGYALGSIEGRALLTPEGTIDRGVVL